MYASLVRTCNAPGIDDRTVTDSPRAGSLPFSKRFCVIKTPVCAKRPSRRSKTCRAWPRK